MSFLRVRLVYWSLQFAVWLTGINIWFQQNNETDVRLIPPFATPYSFWPQMVITLLCSLLLLVLYVPLIHLLRRIFEVPDKKIRVQETPTA
jgi:hypothetical protein